MNSAAASKGLASGASDDKIVAAPRPAVVESATGPLYAPRTKIYPRSVRGRFRSLKWIVLVLCLTAYYVGPWLTWDRGPNAPHQAFLIDMANARAYLLGIEIWPQEIYYLTGLLIAGAIALFLVTSLYGRLWCGYACPQTVWTDLFMLVERLIEGDRNARIKLDRAPRSFSKVAKKAAKHATWLLIAAGTGGAWILYFDEARSFVPRFFAGEASLAQYFFFGLLTLTTYTLAGWAREQVCTYMCPWPRFQAAMQDEFTLTVTYQRWRGEKRGHAPKDGNWDGRGDCIDCRACIAVCPTGIDIRDGQQLECIGCGLCVDACNSIMASVERPLNLIAFATVASQEARAAGRQPPASRLVRPRTVIYAGLLVLVGVVMAAALLQRTTVELAVLPDRAPAFVRLADGAIRNGYTIKIANKTLSEAGYRLDVENLPGATLAVAGSAEAAGERAGITVRPDGVGSFRLLVRQAADQVKPGHRSFHLVLIDEAGHVVARHGTQFFAPER